MTDLLMLLVLFGPELLVFLLLSLLPGALAGIAIGFTRGRTKAGFWSGAIGGTAGGIFGLVAYKICENTLSQRRDVRESMHVHHPVSPPPLFIVWLSIIGGSLMFAILCTALLVKRRSQRVAERSGRAAGLGAGSRKHRRK